ncbi:MAG: hypothetical protein IK017_11440 [Paludibacteraceae bacterium]|nr:hypothetical protein [Paludibacteraceae bacterium]MBR5973251.1 hypothetical protein [Paludibacteraceae bacterium]
MAYIPTQNFHEFILKELIEKKNLSLKEVKEELIKLEIDASKVDLIINDLMPQIKKLKRKNAFITIITGFILIIVSILLLFLSGGFFFYGIMIFGIIAIIYGIITLIKFSF